VFILGGDVEDGFVGFCVDCFLEGWSWGGGIECLDEIQLVGKWEKRFCALADLFMDHLFSEGDET
jgi:hypothetical protein